MIEATGKVYVKPRRFRINHPLYDSSEIYTVHDIRSSDTGDVIIYEEGEIHSSMCEFIETEWKEVSGIFGEVSWPKS